MRLSNNGRKFLMNEEGLSLTAYPDPQLAPLADGSPNPAQKYSIGYGHSGAYKGQRITREEAEALLVQDIVKHETAVSLAVPNATQAQFDAMVALSYNIGTAGFSDSSVVRRHAMGDYAGAADAFALWNKSGSPKAVNPVLVARRARERQVYLGLGYPGIDGSVYQPSPSPAPAPSPIPWGSLPTVASGSLPPLAVAACAALAAYWALPKVPFARRALSLGV